MAVAGQLGEKRLGRGPVPSEMDADPDAARRELDRHLAPDAPGGAGDERRLSIA